ncbi:MAG: chemoreceptor glutamine deamidase CheD [Pseudomonadota bacterium]
MEMPGSDSDQPRVMAPPLAGFEKIHRYWDRALKIHAAKILPGEYYVTTQDEAIVTVLGSCVSACIRDRVMGVGGMNHFMLPVQQDENPSAFGAAERYGNFAMEHLINTILKNGGRRQNLEVKLFGGGRILAQMTDIGKRNIEFVRQYVSVEKMLVTAEDLGDVTPRKVAYYPLTGKVLVKKLRSLHGEPLVDLEKSYMDEIAKKPVQGDVDLF